MIEVRAVPTIDRLDRGDERVLLVPGRAVRIVGLALPLLDLVTDWRTLDEVVTGLEQSFGPAPGGEAESIVATAIRDLEAEGLVETRTRE